MNRRAVFAAALLVVVAGCSQPEVRSQTNASVSIDGKEQGQGLTVRCNQMATSWFLDVGTGNPSANAIIDVEGDKVTVQSVKIRGYGDFTGSYWNGGDQTAEATLVNRRFTINGTASGLTHGSKPATMKFQVIVRC